MAALDSIQALLAALKQRQDGPSGDDDDTTGVGASMIGDDPDDTTDPNDDPDDQDSKIVGVLRNAYPKIYQKILGQLSKDDDGEDEDMGDSAMVMPSMPPSAMQ